MLGKK